MYSHTTEQIDAANAAYDMVGEIMCSEIETLPAGVSYPGSGYIEIISCTADRSFDNFSPFELNHYIYINKLEVGIAHISYF